MSTNTALLTIAQVKDLYCNQQTVEKYSTFFKNSPRHRRKDQREKNSIAKSMYDVLPGALVLDLPCGAGRLYPFLKEEGFNVVSADSSPYMVSHAQKQAERMGYGYNPLRDKFEVADVMCTNFEDKQFDAIICNRLFHHFHESEMRQKALRELGRICSGPIVVSFFSTIATDALKFYYQKNILHKPIKDRIPISPKQFAEDAKESGLRIEKWIMARPLMSMQWYVRLRAV